MFDDFEVRGGMQSEVDEEKASTDWLSESLVAIMGVSGFLGAQVCLAFVKDGS